MQERTTCELASQKYHHFLVCGLWQRYSTVTSPHPIVYSASIILHIRPHRAILTGTESLTWHSSSTTTLQSSLRSSPGLFRL